MGGADVRPGPSQHDPGAAPAQIERMPAADYLRASYYEKWLYALVENAIRLGLITREEAETGRADLSSPRPSRNCLPIRWRQ